MKILGQYSHSKFYRGHRYPDTRIDAWFPGREANAVFLDYLAGRYDADKLTPLTVYETALERAAVLAVPA